MGRGDKKTKKGKIFKGSFGKSRPARPVKEKKAAAKKETNYEVISTNYANKNPYLVLSI